MEPLHTCVNIPSDTIEQVGKYTVLIGLKSSIMPIDNYNTEGTKKTL